MSRRDGLGRHDPFEPDPFEPDTPEQRNRELQRQIGRREQSDAWGAFSLLLSGLLVYGGLGWLVAHLTGIQWLLGLGIVLGAAGGLLAVWLRYGKA
ncbi:MAG TPA: hypothetical protein VFR99_10650 [Marmoricola sp.]|jgi:hypothetical protein|nr:hypothetical protein [Marmoricola sp.]